MSQGKSKIKQKDKVGVGLGSSGAWEEWGYLGGELERVEDKYDQNALHTCMKLSRYSFLSGQET